MQVTSGRLTAPSSQVLRSRACVQALASRMRGEPGTASEKVNMVVATIYFSVVAGHPILTSHGVEIDMMKRRTWRDPHVYPVDGGQVFKELPYFRLLEPSMAFHEDGKRTMLRIMAKADGMETALDIRLLSAVFWIAAYIAITDHEG